MGDAIIYRLPNGKQIYQDVDRVAIMPSDNGLVEFISDEAKKILMRVGKPTKVQLFLDGDQVTNGIAYLDMEVVNDEGSTGNV